MTPKKTTMTAADLVKRICRKLNIPHIGNPLYNGRSADRFTRDQLVKLWLRIEQYEETV